MHGLQNVKCITPTGEESCLVPLGKIFCCMLYRISAIIYNIVDFFYILLTSDRSQADMAACVSAALPTTNETNAWM
jgi:hypothetical protein